MKVIITGFDNPNRWYKNKIGEIFDVRPNDRPESYIVNDMVSDCDSEYRIEKKDCKVLDQN